VKSCYYNILGLGLFAIKRMSIDVFDIFPVVELRLDDLDFKLVVFYFKIN
jgi:hypothetical protein